MIPARDTIAAVATAPGRGGVGIVRVSGPRARAIAITLSGREPTPRHAHYGPFHADDGEVIDEGLLLFFPGPHSFTGEDVLELHGHGGPVVLDMLLQRCVDLGVRLARPGEFSERAFLNDKLDLAQAEAIADLIEASSAQAARNAVRSLQGEFSRRVHQLTERLIQLRIYVEAAIDFPEEEIGLPRRRSCAGATGRGPHGVIHSIARGGAGRPVARWHDRGHRGSSQRWQIQSAQRISGARGGHRHRYCRYDP